VGWSKPAGEQVRAGVIYTDMKSGEDDMKHRVLRALVVTLVPLALAPFMAVALAPAAVAAETVRVGKAVPFAWTFTPIDVGIEVGIFTKQDLELQVTGFAGDARLQQGLVSDSIDLGLGSGPGMGFLAKGSPAKAVAAMAGAPMNMSIVVPYDSTIKTLDDLKGRKVGITTVGSLLIGCSNGWSRQRSGPPPT
jgi:ABC-type nitrate/sulfonate/bicarbonate transport system substrate-binding protein